MLFAYRYLHEPFGFADPSRRTPPDTLAFENTGEIKELGLERKRCTLQHAINHNDKSTELLAPTTFVGYLATATGI